MNVFYSIDLPKFLSINNFSYTSSHSEWIFFSILDRKLKIWLCFKSCLTVTVLPCRYLTFWNERNLRIRTWISSKNLLEATANIQPKSSKMESFFLSKTSLKNSLRRTQSLTFSHVNTSLIIIIISNNIDYLLRCRNQMVTIASNKNEIQ